MPTRTWGPAPSGNWCSRSRTRASAPSPGRWWPVTRSRAWRPGCKPTNIFPRSSSAGWCRPGSASSGLSLGHSGRSAARPWTTTCPSRCGGRPGTGEQGCHRRRWLRPHFQQFISMGKVWAMWILIMEISLLCLGVRAIATGKFRLSTDRVVYGGAARVLGLIAMMPMPLAFCAGFAVGFVRGYQGQTLTDPSVRLTLTAIEAGAVIVCTALVYGMGWFAAGPPGRSAQFRAQQGDLMRSSLPAWMADKSVPADSLQGIVPLRTMALAGYGTPRPADVGPREPEERRL